MKQANDLRMENLLLTQTCASQFWSEQNQITSRLEQIEKELSKIRPRSTSREHVEREREKFDELNKEYVENEEKLQNLLQQQSLQLLTLINNNPDECGDIQGCINELQQDSQRLEQQFRICRDELEQAMIESAEFNAKLERVSTWFDDTSFPIGIDENNEFERIRTFKEHLDCKYLDIVHLKQDFSDIEQNRGEHLDLPERSKTNLVETQLDQIDSKWSQLNEQIQEQFVDRKDQKRNTFFHLVRRFLFSVKV